MWGGCDGKGSLYYSVGELVKTRDDIHSFNILSSGSMQLVLFYSISYLMVMIKERIYCLWNRFGEEIGIERGTLVLESQLVGMWYMSTSDYFINACFDSPCEKSICADHLNPCTGLVLPVTVTALAQNGG